MMSGNTHLTRDLTGNIHSNINGNILWGNVICGNVICGNVICGNVICGNVVHGNVIQLVLHSGNVEIQYLNKQYDNSIIYDSSCNIIYDDSLNFICDNSCNIIYDNSGSVNTI